MKKDEATEQLQNLFKFLQHSDLFISEQTAVNFSRYIQEIGGSAKTTAGRRASSEDCLKKENNITQSTPEL